MSSVSWLKDKDLTKNTWRKFDFYLRQQIHEKSAYLYMDLSTEVRRIREATKSSLLQYESLEIIA